ncbi:MAG TPA: formate--tetrahydrofolate ligase [Methylomirabilota bacterium]|jgi:formate--tetrahydrofolate ligase|nr:formate--tetrahydrofolate ligase [Methylomirabilota bacterium]
MGKQDLEIARTVTLQPIQDVAATLGLGPDDIEPYGRFKAKVGWDVIARLRDRPDGALVLVTAMTPTPAGEGKSTTTVGLGDGLRRLGKRAVVALREPSLGPVFGMKGGATGGGRAQLAPMEDINLHFTGDFHAIGAAHNLLAAMLDNHLAQGNALRLDTRRILLKRVVDMNDRALRHIVIGLGGPANGVPREAGYEIVVASEVMAALCLAADLTDFKERVARIVVGETADGALVHAGALKAAGAMAVLMKDAIKPNLVQTLEHTPALVHGGPFGNIAHGCNSLIATRLASKLAEVVVTEAGFASDLGAEKFVNIKCRTGGLVPSVAVVVATIRALKMHGGVALGDLRAENVEAVRRGLDNLAKHVENVRLFGLSPVVALNHFVTDTDAEVAAVIDACRAWAVPAEVSRGWELGGAGTMDLGRAVLDAIKGADRQAFRLLYPDDLTLAKKIETIATRVYGADGVRLAPAAAAKLARWESLGFGRLPVCMAKTQNSLSDDPRKPGRPRGFTVTVRDARLCAGAGFVVAYAGDILTMPGLPREPGAESMDVDAEGNIIGLS